MRRLHRDDSSRASLALLVPVVLFGGGLLALAVVSGEARQLLGFLPLPEPDPDDFAGVVLLVIVGGAWWRMSRAETPAHEQAELVGRDNEQWPTHGEPLQAATWPLADAGSPWFGTAPFSDLDAAPHHPPAHPKD